MCCHELVWVLLTNRPKGSDLPEKGHPVYVGAKRHVGPPFGRMGAMVRLAPLRTPLQFYVLPFQAANVRARFPITMGLLLQ